MSLCKISAKVYLGNGSIVIFINEAIVECVTLELPTQFTCIIKTL